jgi:ubiquinone/menaquinone biosynthesis C-methylase UbiE
MYEQPNPEYGFNMPQAAGPEVTRLFDMALQEMNLQGNEAILDLGAGAGWASSHFARKGCEVIAVDIVLDDTFGLGRSWAIMEHTNTWFDPICADGNNLPFLPNQFDIVFFFGSLHHFVDFKKVLEQAYKVLKPGGRLIASGEPFISIFFKERDVQATIEETTVGITERRPYIFHYIRAAKQVGFKNVRWDIFETYHRSPSEVYRWISDAMRSIRRAVKTRYRPLVWLIPYFCRLLPYRWAAYFVLCVNGGTLFLRAVKPPPQLK